MYLKIKDVFRIVYPYQQFGTYFSTKPFYFDEKIGTF